MTRQIVRRTLHDEVVDQLRDMIIEAELKPGERINESELCLRLGVSRTPLREAIKTLTSEGLIEAVRNKGATIKVLNRSEVTQLLEAVTAIEQWAARAGVERATDAEIEAIAAVHEEMCRRHRAGDRLGYYKLNQSIHASIVALARNPTLSSMHEVLQRRLRRMRFVGTEAPPDWLGALAEHEMILQGLKARNADAMAEAVAVHLRRTRERLEAFCLD